MKAIVQGGSVIASLGERILGRTTAEDIVDSKDGSILIETGTLLDEAAIARIEAIGIQAVRIRSPLICQSKMGVCGKCYGRDLARGTPVNIGEAVGVIAAQSIRSEEHTSELQSLMRISYAVFCLKKKNKTYKHTQYRKEEPQNNQ